MASCELVGVWDGVWDGVCDGVSEDCGANPVMVVVGAHALLLALL